MTFLNGLVGHHGRYGCRLYCSMPGRCKDCTGHYYAATQKPDGYTLQNSNYDDIKLSARIPKMSRKIEARYNQQLRKLVESATSVSTYESTPTETGSVV